ncbi:MAG: hypothetical protein ACI87E_005180 [Mariniblastus sp.]|jgi:hypothetical protein
MKHLIMRLFGLFDNQPAIDLSPKYAKITLECSANRRLMKIDQDWRAEEAS